MNMIRKFFLLVLLIAGFYYGKAQSPADSLAKRISVKMKDSLSLSASQQSAIYDINMQLQKEKMVVRQQKEKTEIGHAIQKIENTRDSLYRQVLTEKQYLLYKQKKRFLVNNK